MNHAEFYADFETVEKNTNKCAKLDFVLFYTTNLQMFLTIKFFWVHFFSIISVDLKSASSLHILNTQMEIKFKQKLGSLPTYLSNIWK